MNSIRLAFLGIWLHKLRSFLTMLGIIIGIAAIIAIASTILGINEQIKQNLIGAGNNTVEVAIYQGDWQIDPSYQTLPANFTTMNEEVKAGLAQIENVEAVSLYHKRYCYNTIYYSGTSLDGGSIYGADADLLNVYGYQMRSGRGFTNADFTQYKKVVIIDSVAEKNLFPGETAVGKTLEISGEPFIVIGVCIKSEKFQPVINSIEDYYTYMNTGSGNVYVTDTAWQIIYGFDGTQSVVLRATSTDAMADVGSDAADYLNEYYSVADDSEFRFKGENLLEQAEQLQELSSSTNSQLIWIAGISLLVGGIGVMNIMLVSVTERTREIGLKKALGARRGRIAGQFLTESAVLTFLGGLLGVGAGVGLAYGISALLTIPIALSVPIMTAAVLFSAMIGIFFGIVPAVKAANLSPIEALRRE